MAIAVVAVIGTLDTKGPDYQFVVDQLSAHGVKVVMIDAGVEPGRGFRSPVDFPQESVADAGGSTIERLRQGKDRGTAISTMAEGAAAIISRLGASGALDGVLALGGSGGSSIAARAVRDLPVGLPKLIVSTMASGDVSPYVGASDVTLMYSVVDIAGINRIPRGTR